MLLNVRTRAGSDADREDSFDGACDTNLDEPLTVSLKLLFGVFRSLRIPPMCKDSC
jgi:hypothetical protein